MKKPSHRKTAAELLAELQANPDHVEAQREREAARQQQVSEWRRAEVPIVDELRAAGIELGSVWDLVNRREPYPDAVPILLEHLQRDYPGRVREGIARALAVPEAKLGWAVLLDSFLNEDDPSVQGPKWALACALGVAADDDVIADVIRLVNDARHGENRAPLLDALARSGRPEARAALDDLRGDPVLSNDVERVLARRIEEADRYES